MFLTKGNGRHEKGHYKSYKTGRLHKGLKIDEIFLELKRYEETGNAKNHFINIMTSALQPFGRRFGKKLKM